MKRVFTQTISGRYKVGQIRDWPMSTWNWIADSKKMSVDDFSRPIIDETFIAQERLVPGRARKEQSYA